MQPLEIAWEKLEQQGERLRQHHLRDLFAHDKQRFERFSRQMDDMLVDFSREQLDQAALDSLLDLARSFQLEARRDELFTGEKLNLTEGRSVLHMALRDGVDAELEVAGEKVLPQVQAMRERFLGFAEQVRAEEYSGNKVNLWPIMPRR